MYNIFTVFGIYVANAKNTLCLRKHIKYVAFADGTKVVVIWKPISREVTVKVIRLWFLPCPQNSEQAT